MNPKEELIKNIEKKMSLFQQTLGASNSNNISTLTIILNDMGNTILSQFAKIEQLEMQIANMENTKKDENTTG